MNDINTDDLNLTFEMPPERRCAQCGTAAYPREFQIRAGSTIIGLWAKCFLCGQWEAVDWKPLYDRPRGLVDAGVPS